MTNEQRLLRFTNKTWGKDFKFRKYQKEVILDILDYYDKNPKGSYILDAPTGTGKSIIGMCFAGVLQSKHLSGYILTSDLGLQNQYEQEFEAASARWFTVKGKSNYHCHVNGRTADEGDCVISKIPASKLECYDGCAYYMARRAASASPVTLLNYSYWLLQMNYVLPKIVANAPFQKRNFIIADEAHKITEIVQSHFSPKLSKKNSNRLEKLNIFVSENNLGSLGFLTDEFDGLLDQIIKTESTSKIYKCLLDMENCLNAIKAEGENIAANLNIEYKGENKRPKHIEIGMSGFDYSNDLYNKVKDFNNVVKKTSHEEIVKIYNDKSESVTLKTINENHLMQTYFHDVSDFQLYMSATITGKDAFMEDVNIQGARYVHIPSTWNFDKSNIFVWPGKKMSYNNIDENTPWLVNKIEQVLDIHKGERGIIHTGSYHFANTIHSKLKKKYRDRVLIYNGSAEKEEMLEYLKYNDDTVIMGPSIIEGINLYDDLSRFQIIAKVPFPSLADKFIKRKMNLKKSWYSWKTVNSLVQGIGRSVRSEDDYAATYIFDGNFTKLYFGNEKMFPIEFKKRVKIIK